jgi:hypothetical protein
MQKSFRIPARIAPETAKIVLNESSLDASVSGYDSWADIEVEAPVAPVVLPYRVRLRMSPPPPILANASKISGVDGPAAFTSQLVRHPNTLSGVGDTFNLTEVETANHPRITKQITRTPTFAQWTALRSGATMTASGVTYSGSPSNWVDGGHSENTSWGIVATGWASGDYYQLDMGRALIVNGMRVFTGNDVVWPAGTYTQKCTVYGSNDPTFATSTLLVDDVELGDAGHIVTGGAVEQGDVTSFGNWRRTYGWVNETLFRYYRFLYKSGAGYGWWYSTEMTFRVG